MDIFDAIATRRSVRKYTDRPMTDEDAVDRKSVV